MWPSWPGKNDGWCPGGGTATSCTDLRSLVHAELTHSYLYVRTRVPYRHVYPHTRRGTDTDRPPKSPRWPPAHPTPRLQGLLSSRGQSSHMGQRSRPRPRYWGAAGGGDLECGPPAYGQVCPPWTHSRVSAGPQRPPWSRALTGSRVRTSPQGWAGSGMGSNEGPAHVGTLKGTAVSLSPFLLCL